MILPGSFILALLVVLTGADEIDTCVDLNPRSCARWEKLGYCQQQRYKTTLQSKCRKTCDYCTESKCFDIVPTSRCEDWANIGLCYEGKVSSMCAYSCGTCSSIASCPSLVIDGGQFVGEDGSGFNRKNAAKTDISEITEAGGGLQVRCNTGYELMGAGSVTCQEDGQYDGQLGVCVRKNECDLPYNNNKYNQIDRYFLLSPGASFLDDTVAPGTYVYQVCTNGRKQRSYCSSYGTWLPPIKDCADDTVDWSRWYETDNQVEGGAADQGGK